MVACGCGGCQQAGTVLTNQGVVKSTTSAERETNQTTQARGRFRCAPCLLIATHWNGSPAVLPLAAVYWLRTCASFTKLTTMKTQSWIQYNYLQHSSDWNSHWDPWQTSSEEKTLGRCRNSWSVRQKERTEKETIWTWRIWEIHRSEQQHEEVQEKGKRKLGRRTV